MIRGVIYTVNFTTELTNSFNQDPLTSLRAYKYKKRIFILGPLNSGSKPELNT